MSHEYEPLEEKINVLFSFGKLQESLLGCKEYCNLQVPINWLVAWPFDTLERNEDSVITKNLFILNLVIAANVEALAMWRHSLNVQPGTNAD